MSVDIAVLDSIHIHQACSYIGWVCSTLSLVSEKIFFSLKMNLEIEINIEKYRNWNGNLNDSPTMQLNSLKPLFHRT